MQTTLWYRNGQYVRLMRRNTNSTLKSTRILISSRRSISLLIILRWRLEQGGRGGLTQKAYYRGNKRVTGLIRVGVDGRTRCCCCRPQVKTNICRTNKERSIGTVSSRSSLPCRDLPSAQIHFYTNFYGLRCYNKVNQFDEQIALVSGQLRRVNGGRSWISFTDFAHRCK